MRDRLVANWMLRLFTIKTFEVLWSEGVGDEWSGICVYNYRILALWKPDRVGDVIFNY
ncbi:hypothetical protein SAMN05192533_11845 [Mesobacillus persicus]|uniref:Uncharacterized protein n=1 Tax=Mesobacillus persicus TaxID=930146 RepID=A0A1H8IT89_9BACI|nr:hypothetical protein SAMN05192533_11845 [Mesobacillus persicus]